MRGRAESACAGVRVTPRRAVCIEAFDAEAKGGLTASQFDRMLADTSIETHGRARAAAYDTNGSGTLDLCELREMCSKVPSALAVPFRMQHHMREATLGARGPPREPPRPPVSRSAPRPPQGRPRGCR